MNIETKRLLIRAAEQEDAGFLAALINDPEVRDSLGAYNLVFPTSKEMEARWLADVQKAHDQIVMIIASRTGIKPLGLIALSDMSDRNASAHLSIMIERKSWGKGYGSEAIIGLLERLFINKNTHRVWLRVDEGNARAIRCYEKCGFRKEGALREDHFAKGSWRNSIVMSILADEFKRASR